MIINYDPKLFKTKRNIVNCNQIELAAACGLRQSTISNVETGDNDKPSTILLIGLVLDWLADEQGKLDAFYELENRL